MSLVELDLHVCSFSLKVITLHSSRDTKRKIMGCFFHPAHPKGRHLASCGCVCEAARSPQTGAWQRGAARTPGLSPTKRSTVAVSETLVYLFSYSLPNQYQKQQKRRRREDTQKHARKQTNACSVGGEN